MQEESKKRCITKKSRSEERLSNTELFMLSLFIKTKQSKEDEKVHLQSKECEKVHSQMSFEGKLTTRSGHLYCDWLIWLRNCRKQIS